MEIEAVCSFLRNDSPEVITIAMSVSNSVGIITTACIDKSGCLVHTAKS